MAIHGVVRTDNLHGTDVRADGCKSIYFYSGTSMADIDNGNVVLIDGPISGEREALKATAVAANSKLEDIALVANPEVMYDEKKKGFEEYYNEAGKLTRAYKLKAGDQFGVTKECLSGKSAPEVGDSIELAAGTKWNVVAAGSETPGSTALGTIDYIEKGGKYTYYVITIKPGSVTPTPAG